MTIKEIWGQSAEKLAENKMDLALSKLRTNAERVIVGYQEKVLDAKDGLSKVMREAAKESDFQKIIDSQMAVLLAEKYLNEALNKFEELFGEQSRYQS